MGKMHEGDANPEPDITENERCLSDEWLSDNGALIDVTIVDVSWDPFLVADLKARGPVMLDLISARLSLDSKRVSLFLCNDDDSPFMNKFTAGLTRLQMFCHSPPTIICSLPVI